MSKREFHSNYYRDHRDDICKKKVEDRKKLLETMTEEEKEKYKQSKRDYMKEYRKNNSKKISLINEKYRNNHKEEMKIYQKEYRSKVSALINASASSNEQYTITKGNSESYTL